MCSKQVERAQNKLFMVIFEYKYIWRDRNISISKIRREHCSDNFNDKRVIIRGYQYECSRLTSYQFVVIERCYVFILFILWTFISYKLDRIQSNFVKMKQEPQRYNIISDKLEFVRNTLKIMWRFSSENSDDFSMKSWLCFAEKFNDFWKKI